MLGNDTKRLNKWSAETPLHHQVNDVVHETSHRRSERCGNHSNALEDRFLVWGIFLAVEAKPGFRVSGVIHVRTKR